MLIPAPRSGRDLFDALRVYDPELGLSKFLDRLDLADMSPRQAVYCAFGRLASAQAARKPPNYNPRGHLRKLLLGDEFQKQLMVRVLESYPEKRRTLLVHIPKCAGSDLSANLLGRMPGFNFRLIDRAWFNAEDMLRELGKLVQQLAYSDQVAVYGHMMLKQYIAESLVRFGDSVIAIVRNPLEMVVSSLNYILTRFAQDPNLKAVDTRNWLKLLSHEKVLAAIASGDYRDIAIEMLFTPGLIESNSICVYLGEGNAASARNMCARADVEISHVSRYDEWVALRWGVRASRRTNASRPFVSLDMLGADALARVELLTVQDRVFEAAIKRKLQEDDTCFVMGTQLEG